MRKLLSVLSFLALLSLAQEGMAAQYHLTPVDGICGDAQDIHVMVAQGINDLGQVVGVDEVHLVSPGCPSCLGDIRYLQAFFWDPSTGIACLPDLDGGMNASWAFDINNSGQVVGYCNSASGQEACLWEKNAEGQWTVRGLGDLEGGTFQSSAQSINSVGQIVGYGHTDVMDGMTDKMEAFIWEAGSMRLLRDPRESYDWSRANDVNDSGFVTGTLEVRGYTAAFLWRPIIGLMESVMLPTPYATQGVAINAAGHILAADPFSAYVTGLPGGVLGFAADEPKDINDRDQATGGTSGGSLPPFVWDPASGPTSLQFLLDSASAAYQLTFANAINESAWIAGGAILQGSPRDQYLAVVLTPDADGDGDGYAPPLDCNDSDPLINPGAAEVCDGMDNNCDAQIDEGLPPVFSVSPGALGFTALAGAADPAAQTLSIANTGCAALAWTASVSPSSPWLSVSPASGTDAGTVNVAAGVAGLAPGTYPGAVTLAAAGATPVNVPVTFTVEAPVTVSAPNGGEIWKVRTTQTIRWVKNPAFPNVSAVDISYTTNGGASWTAIKTVKPTVSSYGWRIPATPSANCKVRVTLKNAKGISLGSDESNDPFTIQ